MTHNPLDRVRITHTPCRYHGYVGTVEEILPADSTPFPYGVAGLEDWLLWFAAGELVKVEGS